MSDYIEERTYYPEGADHDDWNVRLFTVGVYYRGKGKWMVARQREGHEQLSQSGKWLYAPSKMNALNWCRFDFETACKLAERHINTVTVMTMTWSEHEERMRERGGGV